VRRRECEWIISTCLVPTVKHGGGGVMVWGCFAGDNICDLFIIQGTLNQHGYHRILQQYAIPSGLRLVGLSFVTWQLSFITWQWPNTPPGCVRAIWPRRRVMEWCIRLQPNWDGLGWVGLQDKGKAANKCSAYVGTPSRLKSIPGEGSWENAKSVQSYFEESEWRSGLRHCISV
jgi:hypothetical protein